MTNYDPFEDTGDWPFRDAPPPTERAREPQPDDALVAALGDTAVGAPSFDEDSDAPDEVASEAQSLTPRVTDEPPERDEPALPEPALPEPALPEPAEGAVEEEEADVLGALEGEQEAVAAIEEERELESVEHAPGAFAVPPGPDVLEGGPHGFRRNVAVVVSRFNGDVTSRMLAVALDELRECHVADEAITVVPVPGAFELPLAALALAKTRHYACIVALGCVVRGETAHFDLVAGEAASGLQLAAIETGVPVSFGVLACETTEQAAARVDRAAEAARTALEMADLFSHIRTRAAG